jgi:uncharacterized protein (DUF2164 family)
MIRVYLSPRYEVEPNHTRNILAQIVSYPETFEEMVDVSKGQGLCIVDASNATHAAIISDGRAMPLSPLFDSKALFHSGLQFQFSNLNLAMRTAIRDKLVTELDYLTQISDADTFQDLLSEVLGSIYVKQAARGGRTVPKPPKGVIHIAGEKF